MSGNGIGILLLLMLIGGLAGGEILARLLPRWGYPKGKRTVRILMLMAVSAYSGALFTASLTSRERVLARGETLRFCGFYLDCHLGVSVQAVDRVQSIGSARAKGMYHIVQVRVSSNALRATLRLGRPTFKVVDQAGNTFSRDQNAERILVSNSGDSLPLVRPVTAGASYDVRIVFDLPAGVQEPRLHVADAGGVDRVLEGVLIGDDDSILHRPTTLALQ